MKVRYIIEYLIISWNPITYRPVGVWAHGGGRLVAKYRTGEIDLQTQANKGIAMLGDTIPEDILEYKIQTTSPYRSHFVSPVVTDRFSTPEECAETILREVFVQDKIQRGAF